MNKSLKNLYNEIKDNKLDSFFEKVESKLKECLNNNKNSILDQINIEDEFMSDENDICFGEDTNIEYSQKFEDNKGIYYYPVERNFCSIEEERNFTHYYGEENIDKIANVEKLSKKIYVQDDIVTNYIIMYLVDKNNNDDDLLKDLKAILRFKNLPIYEIIKRCDILYDRYHNLLNDNINEFWYLSCKSSDKKNILTLFQNNKQIYCNIDNIYDCNIHTSIEPTFDNPSTYDQIKYIKSYKALLEYALFTLENNYSEISENLIKSGGIDINKKYINNNLNNNLSHDSENVETISNTSSNKILTNSGNIQSKENINNDNINNYSEIIIERKNGSNKLIHLKNFEEDELGEKNNINDYNEFKNYILQLAYEFNSLVKFLRAHGNTLIQSIKRIKETDFETQNCSEKCCSDLCYKKLLKCGNKIKDKCYNECINREFPLFIELLFNKFMNMFKYDPCHIYKFLKNFKEVKTNCNINCYEIYFHLINKKYYVNKIFDKNLFELNVKEYRLSKKQRVGTTVVQTRKYEENQFKKKCVPYSPCTHFGNEICNENCPCAKRGFCEKYCRCNQDLCKFAFKGCHCLKGNCFTNHCPCYSSGRECDPDICIKCVKKKGSKCKNMQILENIESSLLVGKSDIAGWGLFANEDIKKDQFIGEYKGELINEDIANTRDKFKNYEQTTYMFTLDDDFTVDGRTLGNMLRYANHSKHNPNAYPRVMFCCGHHRIGIFAKRHINRFEEIFFDYDGQGGLSDQFSWINDENSVEENLKVANENEKINNNILHKKFKKFITTKGRPIHKTACLIENNSLEESKNNTSNNTSNNSFNENLNTLNKSNSNKFIINSLGELIDEPIEGDQNSLIKSTRHQRHVKKFHDFNIFSNKSTKKSNHTLFSFDKQNTNNCENSNECNINSNIKNKSESESKDKSKALNAFNILMEGAFSNNSSKEKDKNQFLNKKRKFFKTSKNESIESYFKSNSISKNNSQSNNQSIVKIDKANYKESKISYNFIKINYLEEKPINFTDDENNEPSKEKEIEKLKDDLTKNESDYTNEEMDNITFFVSIGTLSLNVNIQGMELLKFTFYSTKKTDILIRYGILNLKIEDLNYSTDINLDLDNDIFGYLKGNNLNINNEDILKEYLNVFDYRVLHQRLIENKKDLYILIKGKLYDQIKKFFKRKNILLDNDNEKGRLFFVIKN